MPNILPVSDLRNYKTVLGQVTYGNPVYLTKNGRGDYAKQLAELVIEMTGSGSKVIYMDLPVDDPTQRKPDISLAKKELGWEPTVELEEGLRKTIEYFKNRIGRCG